MLPKIAMILIRNTTIQNLSVINNLLFKFSTFTFWGIFSIFLVQSVSFGKKYFSTCFYLVKESNDENA